jgi:hypothetical protein
MPRSRHTPARGRSLSAIAEDMVHPSPRPLDDGEGAVLLRRVAGELAGRLLNRGVRLSGTETPEALTDLLEAVENFEAAVESRGGDLMVDEAFEGRGPVQPDNPLFALPARAEGETITKFTMRVVDATARIRSDLKSV